MKEEVKDLIAQLNVCSLNDYNFEIYGSEAKMLKEYISNLQNRIDKAIEVIEKEFDEYNEFVFGIELKNKILDILKESGE